MASLVKAWPAGASVLLLLAAFPPFNLGLLVFVALVPWLVSLRKAEGWAAVRSGFLFGFLYMLGQLLWLQPLTSRWTGSAALSFVPLLLGPLVVAPFFAFGAWLIAFCWRKNWPWLVPIVWSGIEILRSFFPGLAFPWGLVATPLYPFAPVLQLAWFGTIYLVSAWVVLAGVVASQLMAGEKFMAIRGLFFGFLILTFVSTSRYSAVPSGTKTVVTVGQLGIDLAFGDPDANRRDIGLIVDQFQLAAQMQGSKLLVLPEGLVRGESAMPPSVPFQIEGSVPILFGGQRGTEKRFQSAYAYDGEWRFVDKTRLVVFGEYVPGRDWLPFLDSFKLPEGDLHPGENVLPIQVGDLKVGPLLCFEGLFPDVALKQAENGVQLLAVMALDDWYFGTAAPEQLMAASVFRAIETGLPLVRAAPLGYSMAVEPNGVIVSQAPPGKSVPMRVELSIPAKPDAFAASGLYLFAAPVVCFILSGVAWRDRRRNTPAGEQDEVSAKL